MREAITYALDTGLWPDPEVLPVRPPREGMARPSSGWFNQGQADKPKPKWQPEWTELARPAKAKDPPSAPPPPPEVHIKPSALSAAARAEAKLLASDPMI